MRVRVALPSAAAMLVAAVFVMTPSVVASHRDPAARRQPPSFARIAAITAR